MFTSAVIVVLFTMVNEEAGTPPNSTAVAPVKLVPVRVTVVPCAAFSGVHELIVGGAVYTNPANEELPDADDTVTSPDTPAPTTAVIVVAFTTVKEDAGTPPKLTAVTLLK